MHAATQLKGSAASIHPPKTFAVGSMGAYMLALMHEPDKLQTPGHDFSQLLKLFHIYLYFFFAVGSDVLYCNQGKLLQVGYKRHTRESKRRV